MAVKDPTKLLVAVKAFARGNALPLDANEVHDSYGEAASYAASATAYAGQTIKALVDGKYKTYTLQPSESGYVLEEVGAMKQSDLKQFVQIVDTFPATGEQGVIYISGTVGKIYNGTEWKVVFEGVTKAEVKDLADRATALEGRATQLEVDMLTKAPIANPNFTGVAKIEGNNIATEDYVDGLIANLHNATPGIVDNEHPIVTPYKAGDTWRATAFGTFAGKVCEPGDLIIALVARTSGDIVNDDFMVVQANIDGAVTGPAASTDANIVVFDGVTGKIIKDSKIAIKSLEDALTELAKIDCDILKSYNKEQATLISEVEGHADNAAAGALEDAKEYTDGKIAVVNEELGKVDGKFANYYTSNEVDTKLADINTEITTVIKPDLALKATKEELNSAVDTINQKIADDIGAKAEEITEAYETHVSNTVGAIGDVTVKAYVDNAVSTSAETLNSNIATAKGEAITAAQNFVIEKLTVVEF